uniref:Uncharacterized protein n=1 Tax=Triticum urartu TaxID=4572 RepID=A0A8R7QA41_TRIUA
FILLSHLHLRLRRHDQEPSPSLAHSAVHRRRAAPLRRPSPEPPPPASTRPPPLPPLRSVSPPLTRRRGLLLSFPGRFLPVPRLHPQLSGSLRRQASQQPAARHGGKPAAARRFRSPLRPRRLRQQHPPKGINILCQLELVAVLLLVVLSPLLLDCRGVKIHLAGCGEGFADSDPGVPSGMAGSSLWVVRLASLLAVGFVVGSVKASPGDAHPQYRSTGAKTRIVKHKKLHD